MLIYPLFSQGTHCWNLRRIPQTGPWLCGKRRFEVAGAGLCGKSFSSVPICIASFVIRGKKIPPKLSGGLA